LNGSRYPKPPALPEVTDWLLVVEMSGVSRHLAVAPLPGTRNNRGYSPTLVVESFMANVGCKQDSIDPFMSSKGRTTGGYGSKTDLLIKVVSRHSFTLPPEPARMLLSWWNSGFNIHSSRRIALSSREDLKRLVQYIICNPCSVDKMHHNDKVESTTGWFYVPY
jgi:hypothetical protein